MSKEPIIFEKKYFELKQLLIDGEIDEFEKEIQMLSFNELLEFGYFSFATYKGDDYLENYFGVKILGELTYLVSTRNLIVYNPELFEEEKFSDMIFRGLAAASEKAFNLGYYKDAEKFTLRVIDFHNIDKVEEISFLSNLAIIANYNNEPEKEVEYCERMMQLDKNNPQIILNYSYSLNRAKLFDKAKFYLEGLDDSEVIYFQKYNYLVLNSLYGNQDYKKAFEYLTKIGELSEGGKHLNDRNNFLYIHNCLIVWALSGDKVFLQYISDFKNNAQEKRIDNLVFKSQVAELMNRGINQLNNGNLHEANILFNDISKLKGRGELFQLAEFLENICLLIEENKKLQNEPVEKLPRHIDELLKFLLTLKTDELFQEYKIILENYFELLKQFINSIISGSVVKDISKRHSIVKDFNQKNITTSEYVNRSFQLLKLIELYNEEFPNTILKEITKEKFLKKIITLINSGFAISAETSFLYSLHDTKNINMALSETIIKAIRLIQTNEPSFIKDFKSKKTKSLLEADFRNHFYYIFGLSNEIKVDAEALSRVGRTDLRISSNKFGTKTFEFKIWDRPGYDKVVKQLYEYLTDFENDGFIFMVNSNKNSIQHKYIENLKNSEMGFVANSLEHRTIDRFDFLISKHKINVKEKTVFHFIYNIY